jgi:hypothetical protein
MIAAKTEADKVSSEHELRNWLAKNSRTKKEVMIVTLQQESRDKHQRIWCRIYDENSWAAGQNYTLDGNLVDMW